MLLASPATRWSMAHSAAVSNTDACGSAVVCQPSSRTVGATQGASAARAGAAKASSRAKSMSHITTPGRGGRSVTRDRRPTHVARVAVVVAPRVVHYLPIVTHNDVPTAATYACTKAYATPCLSCGSVRVRPQAAQTAPLTR